MTEFMNGRVLVKTGDITRETADAIVNAANSSLLGGGGVDGAIHRVGGPEILDECKKIRKERYPEGLPTGQAVITTGGRLPARFVIHTVGPVWFGGRHGEEKYLTDCYWNSLRLAVESGCRTVAFPAISTGVYRFPRDRAAVAASAVVKDFLDHQVSRRVGAPTCVITHVGDPKLHTLGTPDETIERVVFIFFGEDDERIFLDNQLFGAE